MTDEKVIRRQAEQIIDLIDNRNRYEQYFLDEANKRRAAEEEVKRLQGIVDELNAFIENIAPENGGDQEEKEIPFNEII